MNEENLLKEIGKRFRIERIRLGLTQTQLAERAGYDRSYYCSIEGGKRNFTFRTMCRLVSAMNQDVAYFLKDMPTPIGRTHEAYPDIAADMQAAEGSDEDDRP